jgi:predicted DNA-binding protein with PD1-like motif
VELLSLIGDVAKYDGKPIVHAHVVVGRSRRHNCRRALLEASVRPTCEVFLTESSEELAKAFDPDSGLVLIKV